MHIVDDSYIGYFFTYKSGDGEYKVINGFEDDETTAGIAAVNNVLHTVDSATITTSTDGYIVLKVTLNSSYEPVFSILYSSSKPTGTYAEHYTVIAEVKSGDVYQVQHGMINCYLFKSCDD